MPQTRQSTISPVWLPAKFKSPSCPSTAITSDTITITAMFVRMKSRIRLATVHDSLEM